MLSVFIAAIAPTQADTDLWGHLRFGADIVRGGIPVRDAYAFTSAPLWVNQSWLADVVMHLAWAAGGTAGLVALKLALALAVLGVVFATLRRAGVRSPLLELLLFVCLAGLFPSIPTLRPQLVSLVLFAVVLHLESADEPPRVGRLLAIPPLMAVWANLHGSWTLGLAELALWSAAWFVARGLPVRVRVELAAVVVLAALATLLTPYGVALWTQVAGTFGESLRDVTEWRGLLETHSGALGAWVALVALGVYACVVARPRLGAVLVLCWLAYASWRVRRLLPFFSVATVSLLAPSLATLGRRAPLGRTATGPPRRLLRAVLVAGALSLVASSGWRVVQAFRCLPLDAADPDVRAAAFIATNRLHGRLLTYSDWGLYAIWHFAPALRVSLDGRREFAYPKSELARHNAIYWNAPSALDDVQALDPDYVWLPAELPVTPSLAAHGWRLLFATERSVVLGRATAPHDYVVPPPEVDPRPCFPGDPG